MYWKDVVDAEGDECPHLTRRGCCLPREQRPEGCNSFLCDVASTYLSDEITLDRAEQLLRDAQHFMPPEPWTEPRDKPLDTC